LKNLSHWLRKAPQPVALLADGQRIEVPKSARAWRDLVATIESLEPSKLTALDGQRNVLRSIALESDDTAQPAAASNEMSDLQLFAKLLAEGYQHGMKANQPLVDSAMGFVEKQAQASHKKDVEIERLRGIIHKQNLQILELSGAPASDGDESLLGSILAGVAQASAASGGNPLANVAPIKPGATKK
jgi:hypothetical protein